MKIPKMCLKLLFFYSKWVLQAILSLTVLPNCLSSSKNFDTTFLPDCTKSCSVFFRLLNRKFNEDSKNVLKTVIFSLQMGFTLDLVPETFQTVFLAGQILTPLFSRIVPNLVVFFSVYWIENLMRIPKMFSKLLFIYSKWVLQAILSLTVLSNCVSGSSNFDTTFLPDCIKSCSIFLRLLDRKFNKVSKNVLNTVSFSLQVSFTGILSLTIVSNCVSGSSNFDSVFQKCHFFPPSGFDKQFCL